jgi:predicted amidophosphoribosyltransferase
MQIHGNWDLGYVLDRHIQQSTFLGEDEYGNPKFETIRTEIGEKLYQLKYKSAFENVEILAQEITNRLGHIFSSSSLIIPMPPSKARTRQPVIEIARSVGKKMNKPCLENILIKSGTTAQMKDIPTKEEKKTALLNCFSINDVLSEGQYDVLVIDDLFSTGSSLESACEVLRKYRKIAKIYVVALTRTK